MDLNISEFPWATVVLVALVVIAALVGGGVVIWGEPGALTFKQYLDDLEKFAIAVGILSIGRGVRSGAKLLAARR